jgi:hypothetical protein
MAALVGSAVGVGWLERLAVTAAHADGARASSSNVCLVNHPDWQLPALVVYDQMPSDDPGLLCCHAPTHMNQLAAFYGDGDPPRYISPNQPESPPLPGHVMRRSCTQRVEHEVSARWTYHQPPHYQVTTAVVGFCPTDYPCYPPREDCTEARTLFAMRATYLGMIVPRPFGEIGRLLDYGRQTHPYGVRCCVQESAAKANPHPVPTYSDAWPSSREGDCGQDPQEPSCGGAP